MPAPPIILDLIERFERNIDAYKSGSYNETQVRREFIDPFFEAMGWDVNNTQGNAEAYKDVIHEDAVKVGGVSKAPDYSFRIGGQRKFFVEAKKPSVNIKDTPTPAYQVRRYAWSAKLPLSIVTDFDELAVYDCRIKPDQNDKAGKARIKYYTWRQYAEKWDEIAGIFGKDAILKGSFDKYAESNKAKRGTAEVDSSFLAEIESWRDALAKNIALRNTVSVRELNDCVQRTIDRIIFLRIAEDRGIEDYGILRSLCNGQNTYARLQELFYKADDRYNSGLFHFRHEKDEAEPPDNLTMSLTIDDKPLKDILKRLYYPDSPYEFSVLSADILGQVYEQFLGKVIRLTSDHRAVVEDKPEVKKAGGVFYTPTYIVDYIVKNTVGKLLEGKTPKKVDDLRILDPACGSGSFLIGAYQYLLDWHLKWYAENNPDKHAKAKKPTLYKGSGDAWHLTTAERKRILLNNIYGVDIDSQAVEVTKLSLLLKVLEGETGESLNQQRKLFHERALPDLGGNIKCGNSLIGPDFYEGGQMSMLDEEEMHRVNVFDWQAEFPEIFKAGGFDAVIGNPPWGATLY
ncbi:MAG: N-6 DNA methylase, partial [Syntrophaceae bacterium]|nr:N-6 DNA methylase [Syntrophaceae bacterium]